MKSIWARMLISCIIGVIVGAAAGPWTWFAGLPSWLPGAITGATVPLVFLAIQGRDRNRTETNQDDA